MAWVESRSEHFTARHDDREAQDADEVLDLLEQAREELAPLVEPPPGEVAAVIHSGFAGLALSQPIVPVVRAIAAPASRRYLAGWPTRSEIHLLAPRVLASRASGVPGSLEMLLLAPAAISRRLKEGGRPAFPPGAPDALLLGGSVFDLLASERGNEAAVQLATAEPANEPRETILRAFPGRSFTDTEGVWRAHLARLAGG